MVFKKEENPDIFLFGIISAKINDFSLNTADTETVKNNNDIFYMSFHV